MEFFILNILKNTIVQINFFLKKKLIKKIYLNCSIVTGDKKETIFLLSGNDNQVHLYREVNL